MLRHTHITLGLIVVTFVSANGVSAQTTYLPYGQSTAYPAPSYSGIATPNASYVSVQLQRPAYPASAYSGYAAARPSYPTVATTPTTVVGRYDNPSVYTGLPVTGWNNAQTAYRAPIVSSAPMVSSPVVSAPRWNNYRVPIASSLRGSYAANPITSPSITTSYYAPSEVTSYSPQTTPVWTTTPVQTLPVAPKPRWRLGSGLARFFNSLLGRRSTEYYTSYYRAPITYYRPYTGVDPVSGTSVTVQRPCSSYVYQLQRVPYNSFAPLPSGTTVPVSSCPTVCGTSGLNACSVNGYTPGSFSPPPSSIGQVGGQIVPGDYGVGPIPSTIPNPGNANTMPLTGDSNVGSADLAPMDQPRLEANRIDPAADDSAEPPAQPTPDPDVDAQESDSASESDSPIQLNPPVTRRFGPAKPMQLFRGGEQFTSKPATRAESDTASSAVGNDLAAPELAAPRFSDMRPIGAPERDAPEAISRRTPTESPESHTSSDIPLLPPATTQRDHAGTRTINTTAAEVTVPVREATTKRWNPVRHAAAWEDAARVHKPLVKPQPKRDSSGWLPAR